MGCPNSKADGPPGYERLQLTVFASGAVTTCRFYVGIALGEIAQLQHVNALIGGCGIMNVQDSNSTRAQTCLGFIANA